MRARGQSSVFPDFGHLPDARAATPRRGANPWNVVPGTARARVRACAISILLRIFWLIAHVRAMKQALGLLTNGKCEDARVRVNSSSWSNRTLAGRFLPRGSEIHSSRARTLRRLDFVLNIVPNEME